MASRSHRTISSSLLKRFPTRTPARWWGLPVDHLPVDLRTAVIGAVAGYLSLWSVYHLFKLITGKEGMGYGDFKLLAALGAWLGWQMLLPIIIGAAGVGALERHLALDLFQRTFLLRFAGFQPEHRRLHRRNAGRRYP